MDLATVMLMLAVGSLVFGLLLVVLKIKGSNPQQVPFLIAAKFGQAAGSFILYTRISAFDGITVLANTLLLLGCAYEAWAVRILTGREVKRQVHLGVSFAIAAFCHLTLLLASPYNSGLVFLLQSALYFLPSVFLLYKPNTTSYLQVILGLCYGVTASVFLAAAVLTLGFPSPALGPVGLSLSAVIPVTSFCIFIISGFILLMLAKERSDRQVAEMERSLHEREVQFQRVVETAIEGILMFDDKFRITFANDRIASVLGYSTQEMLGRDYASLFPERYLAVCLEQEELRKQGHDSVYECCLLGKDGQEHWFLVSATAVRGDAGEFEGSFAMLTDITECKEMELALAESNRLLTELSNTDSLTGIANRRHFDATLAREYSRLQRSKSKLSIILFDLDHFKAYNDHYGHVMGDNCLKQFGAAVARCVGRSVDLAARYGGEEFACILPDTGLSGGITVAQRIQACIANLRIEHAASPVSQHVTASFGVATFEYSSDVSLGEIISMADRLLYRAKAAGRNRIAYAEWSGSELKSAAAGLLDSWLEAKARIC